jgi:hypothetical protein
MNLDNVQTAINLFRRVVHMVTPEEFMARVRHNLRPR